MSKHDDFAASIGATPVDTSHDDFAASIGATPVVEDAPPPPEFGQTIADDVDRISRKYNVDPSWLHSHQIGMGYYPPEEADKLVAAGEHGQHLINAGSSTINQVVGEGLLGGLPAWLNKKLSSDTEEHALDELRHAVDHHKSFVDRATEGVLAATPSTIASKLLSGSPKAIGAMNMAEAMRAGVMESDKGDELRGAGTGAAIAGTLSALPYVAEGVKKLDSKLGVSDALRTFAGKKATEALNPTLSQMERLAATKDPAALGNRMLDEGIVTPFATSRNMLERLETKSSEAGQQIGAKLADTDAFIAEHAGDAANVWQVHPHAVADRIEQEIIAPNAEKVAYSKALGTVQDFADQLRNQKKPWTLGEANEQKSAIDKALLKWGQEQPLDKEFMKAARGVLNDEIEKRMNAIGVMKKYFRPEEISEVSQTIKMIDDMDTPFHDLPDDIAVGRELFNNVGRAKSSQDVKEFIANKRRYGDLEAAEDIARKSAARDAKNNDFGLTSYIMGGGAGATIGTAVGGPMGGVIGGALGVGGRELTRKFGNQWLATSARAVSDAIQAGAGGKWADVLKRGGMASHYVLLRNSPEYRNWVGGIIDEFPAVTATKGSFNDALTENVVEPLARAGHENLGAALATIPSVAVDMVAPSTPGDIVPGLGHGVPLLLGAVHMGKWPKGLPMILDNEAKRVLRGSVDKVEGLLGDKNLVAIPKLDSSNFSPTDMWHIFDTKTNEKLGEMEVAWGTHAGPITRWYENQSAGTKSGEKKGLIQDLITKLTDKFGRLSSSMSFAPYSRDGSIKFGDPNAKFLGREMWEKSLPDVVERSSAHPEYAVNKKYNPDRPLYTQLSKENFEKWRAENPNPTFKSDTQPTVDDWERIYNNVSPKDRKAWKPLLDEMKQKGAALVDPTGVDKAEVMKHLISDSEDDFQRWLSQRSTNAPARPRTTKAQRAQAAAEAQRAADKARRAAKVDDMLKNSPVVTPMTDDELEEFMREVGTKKAQ